MLQAKTASSEKVIIIQDDHQHQFIFLTFYILHKGQSNHIRLDKTTLTNSKAIETEADTRIFINRNVAILTLRNDAVQSCILFVFRDFSQCL